MQTNLADFIRETEKGQVAESILRKCVHCGMCTATCPTYHLLGNELDSPRGRIYLMKQALEGVQPTRRTQLHLDRCLTCRSCETTCPSGVQYGQLLEIGREIVEEQVPRKIVDRVIRAALVYIIPNSTIIRFQLGFARSIKWLLPKKLRRQIPEKERAVPWITSEHSRKMIIHQGCIQRVLKPNINSAASRYLNAHSFAAIRAEDGCCGALGLHLSDQKFFLKHARKNIDAWWPHIEAGAEAIVSTASGCGVTIKEYAHLLRDDPNYSSKARKVSSLTIDISEIPQTESDDRSKSEFKSVAFHSPCTLQHGQKINNTVEQILNRQGVDTVTVRNSHMCCGSAGTYSILQPKLSQQLLDQKITDLEAESPECIVTCNIGCLVHLSTASSVPVKHWVEILSPQS